MPEQYVLLDTHALIWALVEPASLSRVAMAILQSEETIPVVSAASVFEIALKHSLGKLPGMYEFVRDPAGALALLDAVALPVTQEHALLAGSLVGAHRDPFDRLLAAQAILEDIPVLSVDRSPAALGAEVVW